MGWESLSGHDALKAALRRRASVAKEGRGEIIPPEIIHTNAREAAVWSIATLWQDQPMLVIIGILGLLYWAATSIYGIFS